MSLTDCQHSIRHHHHPVIINFLTIPANPCLTLADSKPHARSLSSHKLAQHIWLMLFVIYSGVPFVVEEEAGGEGEAADNDADAFASPTSTRQEELELKMMTWRSSSLALNN